MAVVSGTGGVKAYSHLSLTCQFRISAVSVPYVTCQFRISDVSVPYQYCLFSAPDMCEWFYLKHM
jgi:hypothetical protein